MKKRYKWLIGVLLTPFVLLLLVIFLVYLPPIQRFIIRKATTYVSENTDYQINIDHFSLGFPLHLTVNGVTLSHQKDTLLVFDEFNLNVQALPLLKKKIIIDQAAFKEITVNTAKEIAGTSLKGNIKALSLCVIPLDLSTDSIVIKQFKLEDSQLRVALSSTPQEEEKTDTTTATNWKINLQEFNLKNFDLALTQAQDTSHVNVFLTEMNLKDVQTRLKDFQTHVAYFGLQHSSFAYAKGNTRKEQQASRIQLKRLNLRLDTFLFTPEEVKFKQLLLKTPHSSIDASAQIYNASFAKRGKKNSSCQFIARLGQHDLIQFIDTTAFKIPQEPLSIHAKIKGNTSHMQLSPCSIHWSSLLSMQMEGKANYLLLPKHRSGEVKLSVEHQEGNISIGEFNLPPQLSLALEGKLKDNQYQAQGKIAQGKDSLLLTGEYNHTTKDYKGKIDIHHLNVQAFLPADSLYHLTAKLDLEGTGTSPFDAQTQAKAKLYLQQFQVGKQRWENVDLNLALQNNQSTLNLSCHNPMLDVEGSIRSYLTQNQLYAKLNFVIGKVDLKTLALSQEPISAKLHLNTVVQSNLDNRHHIEGAFKSLDINTLQKEYKAKDLKFNLITYPDSTYINLSSGDFKTRFFSPQAYTTLLAQADSIVSYLQTHLTPEKDLPLEVKQYLPILDFSFSAQKKNLLADYLSTLKVNFDAIDVQFSASPDKGLHGDAFIHRLSSDALRLDTLALKIQQDSTKININALVENKKKGQLPLFRAQLESSIGQKTGSLLFSYLDEKKDSTFHIGLHAKKEGEKTQFSVFPQHPTLFGAPFAVNDSNAITFSKDQPIQANLKIADQNGRGMTLYSTENATAQQDLSLELHRLHLDDIAKSISPDLDLSGILNTDLRFILQNNLPIVVSNVDIENLSYNRQALGNLNLTTDYIPSSSTKHVVETHLSINEEERIMIAGSYRSAKKGKLDSELSFFDFPLSFVSTFIPAEMLVLKGKLNGNMSLKGELGQLQTNGYVRFDSTTIASRMIGTRSSFANTPVKVKKNKLFFDHFSMISSNGSPFTIDGNIDFTSLENPFLNLRMDAVNYEVLKAKRNADALLYGRLYVDLHTTLKGPADQLNIKGNVKVAGNTDVTYVIPASSLTVENRLENMVTFTNFKDTLDAKEIKENYAIKGMHMLVNIDVDEGAYLNVDLDKHKKNYVKLQGGGHLTLQYTPQGDLQLSGRYNLNDGEMKYSLPIIPLKTFHVGKGSYVEWINDPMNPSLNLIATEKMRSNVTLNSQSMPVDFNVGVHITNTLSNMGISFLINAPENNTIQNDLATMSESQRNKQAVAMLATGIYLGSENTTKGKLSANDALNSFLQSEITSIAKSALKTVDITLGVEEENNATGGDTHTNYSFRFAKRFWDNRLSIIIGGKVSSGNDNARDNTIIEDVSLEWRLDKSGTRYITLFHKQSYDNILDSEIKKTGVGIVLRKKMTKLGELFIFRRKNKVKKENENKK